MISDVRKSFVRKKYNFVSSILLIDASFISLIWSTQNFYFSVFYLYFL